MSEMIIRHLEKSKLNTQLLLLMSGPTERRRTRAYISPGASLSPNLRRLPYRDAHVRHTQTAAQTSACTSHKRTDAAPLEAQRPSSCSPVSQMGYHW